MAYFDELRTKVLKDRKITADEVAVIRSRVTADGRLDIEDVKLLVGLLSEANEICPEFDELFFPVLREALLADGQILADEQYYLLKMLYADGHVRDCERQFLQELRDEVQPTPAFEELCATAFASADKNWQLGGK